MAGPNRKRKKHGAMTRSTEFDVRTSCGLFEFLRTVLPHEGRNSVKSLLSHHAVSVDGVIRTRFDYPLSPGQKVVVRRPSGHSAADPELAYSGIRILFEDDALIVIEKPSGLLSVATDKGGDRTAYSLLWDHVSREGAGRRVFVVHRLDRDASGIMLYAKNAATKQALQQSWNEVVEERAYAIVVEGIPSQAEGTIESWLDERAQVVRYGGPPEGDTSAGGRRAITRYRVVSHSHRYALLEVRIETGRRNQIRVHMQELGHPVVGDRKYGAKSNPLGRLGLHAFLLAFRHPQNGRLMKFQTEIPREFLKLVSGNEDQ